mmetsp:Transcript_35973/g.80907  ORF Transcript_35973/g.80907 Transcript_35973/m.80907 type:complete len:309 (+) Transcript_35973:468-1394(+)
MRRDLLQRGRYRGLLVHRGHGDPRRSFGEVDLSALDPPGVLVELSGGVLFGSEVAERLVLAVDRDGRLPFARLDVPAHALEAAREVGPRRRHGDAPLPDDLLGLGVPAATLLLVFEHPEEDLGPVVPHLGPPLLLVLAVAQALVLGAPPLVGLHLARRLGEVDRPVELAHLGVEEAGRVRVVLRVAQVLDLALDGHLGGPLPRPPRPGHAHVLGGVALVRVTFEPRLFGLFRGGFGCHLVVQLVAKVCDSDLHRDLHRGRGRAGIDRGRRLYRLVCRRKLGGRALGGRARRGRVGLLLRLWFAASLAS